MPLPDEPLHTSSGTKALRIEPESSSVSTTFGASGVGRKAGTCEMLNCACAAMSNAFFASFFSTR